jgi:LPXTG-motif cell wall-anchored protein
MKLVLTIVGVILILMGVVWILQGFNILPVGFMAGQMQYALLGVILVIGGIGLLAFSRRRRKPLAVPDDTTKGR